MSKRTDAIRDVQALTRNSLIAQAAVDATFYRLIDVDQAMLKAGVAELEKALPPGTGTAYAKNLAAAIWRAMLEAAR